ncbi:MAG: hypothetical protein AAFY29_21515 [Pseudomonadota bacterium]
MMLAGVGLYVVAQLAISVWAARRTRSETDYLLAGRTLGPLAIGMSIFATWFAVEGIVATSGLVAEEGLSGALFDPIGLGLGIIAFALLVAGPIRRGQNVMLSGFLGARFGTLSESLAGFIVCASAIIWSSVQILALAVLLASISSLSVFGGLILATTLVLAYTMLGGLLGDIVTDMVQGAVLAIGLVICLVLIIGMGGGAEAAFVAIPAERTDRLISEDSLSSAEVFLSALATSIAGAELAGRTLGARSAAVARNGALIGGGIYLTVGAMPVLFGLLGPQLGLDFPAGDGYLPAMIQTLMPTWLQVVFMGALLSAIFSTVDSALLAVSAVATESVYRRLRPAAGEREGLVIARLTTVGAGVLAFFIAAYGESIRTLALQGASVGGCLLVPVLLGVLTKSGGERGAPASILVVFSILFWLQWLHPVTGAFLYAVAGALLAYGIAELPKKSQTVSGEV